MIRYTEKGAVEVVDDAGQKIVIPERELYDFLQPAFSLRKSSDEKTLSLVKDRLIEILHDKDSAISLQAAQLLLSYQI